MAHVLADRVKATSTTTGTGTYTLGSAVVGFQAFSVIGDGNTTYYCATDGSDWEVGVGTYATSGTTLARTTILASSNAGAAVNWGAGTRTIFVTFPAAYCLPLVDPNADRIVFWDDSAGAYAYLTPGTGLSITTTSIDVAVASQADQETSTSNTVMVTPGVQQFHPSAAKFWAIVTANGTTLSASYNLTSRTDSGSGDLLLTIATDFSSANWAHAMGMNGIIDTSAGSSTSLYPYTGTKAAGTIQLLCLSGTASSKDPNSSWCCVGFGDQ